VNADTDPDRIASIPGRMRSQLNSDNELERTSHRTFLIADIRGYTAFTRERGDESAARLAAKFAEVAREAAAARSGEVIELRGDEALAVFASPSQAVRAASELIETCSEETAEDPSLPLTVGIGVDLGEAVPVEGGFRGKALNTAARLCSRAVAGEVLVTGAVAEAAGVIERLRFEEHRALELKGFEAPVDVVGVVSDEALPPHPQALPESLPPLPLEFDTLSPLVDRMDQLRWLRGTWRQVRRRRGRLLFVSGPAGIGKTRLLAELAGAIHGRDGIVRYAGPGGAGSALALRALREAGVANTPTLLVLDDVELLGEEVVVFLGESANAIAKQPVMVVATFRGVGGFPALASLVERFDGRGDSHRILPPLDASAVEVVARLYAGADVVDLPLESVFRASSGVPARVHELVSEWARDEAGRRLAAAAEYLAVGKTRRSADLEFANNVIALKLGRLYAAEGAVGGPGVLCPYKGLAAFHAEDAAYFFGRERLVGELAARTVGTGLLGVVGASGSGKSSTVMGGLVPSLSAGLLPGSERWRAVVMRPGERPIHELSTALTWAGLEPNGGDPLEEAAGRAGPGARIVLIVDQFEELFSAGVDAEERDTFLRSLIGAAVGGADRVVVLPTLRGDFYSHLAEHEELAQLFAANHVLFGSMNPDELRRAIELPARRAGVHVESALTDAMIADVEEEPGGLPLLSTALVELWAARERGWLTLEAYERTGGVHGAVARLAERSFERLSELEQQAARRVLLRLVGTREGEAFARRRVATAEFDLARDVVAHAVLDRLTQDRLLTRSDGWVEVAHEALIREWPRLGEWLQEDLEGHRVRAHLTQAAGQWGEGNRDPGELYRGARLSTTLDWATTHAAELNALERTFLSESRQATEGDAQRQRRTNRRLRALLAGVVMLLALALVASGLAVVQRGRAEREQRIAFARELATAAAANLEADAERALLLAMEAVRTYQRAGVPVGKDALEVLHAAVQADRVVMTLDHPSTANAAISPDGRLIATGGTLKGTGQNVVVIWDARTGEQLRELQGHTGDINDLNFSPDGSRLVTVAADKNGIIWNPRTGERLVTLSGHTDLVQGVSFSNDGSLVATSGWDGTLRIWDVDTGRQLRSIQTSDGLCYNAFSPDDSLVAVGHCLGDIGTVWSVDTGRRRLTLRGHEGGVVGVFFSPDGDRVATGSLDGTVMIWDATTGQPEFTLSGHTDWVLATPFSPDGRTVASASTDGSVRLWDARTGRALLVLSGHGGPIGDVAWGPDGTRLITGGVDATAKVWDVTASGSRDALTLTGHDGSVSSVAYAADGSTLVTAASDGTARLWDASSGEEIARFEDASIQVGASLSADGTLLLTTGGTPAIWDVSARRKLMTLDPEDDSESYPSAAFGPDGAVVVGGSIGTATLFDRTGAIVRRFVHSRLSSQFNAAVLGLTFSPDESLLATASADSKAKLWSVETGELLRTFEGHGSPVNSVAFSPDGRRLVTSSVDGVAKVWDVRSARVLATLRGHTGVVWDAEFSPDGDLIATAGEDTTVRVWEASTGREILKLTGHTFAVRNVAFSPDGSNLASASVDGTVRVYFLRLGDLMRAAAERISRTFTEDECRQYLHVETCPPDARATPPHGVLPAGSPRGGR
jgi:WD40 repeat protein/class 3 adenylate cyclase